MKKGFTLVELLIVIIIIGILATMAVPQYNKMVNRAKAVEGITIMGTILNGQVLYYVQNSGFASTLIPVANLDVSLDTNKWIGEGVSSNPFGTIALPYCAYQIYKVGTPTIKVAGKYGLSNSSKEIESCIAGDSNASSWQ